MERSLPSRGVIGEMAVLVIFLFPLTPEAHALQADAATERQAALQFNTAGRLYRQENWRDAATAFGKFLDRFPDHADAPEARFARGYCLHRLGDHWAAVDDLGEARRAREAPWAADANFYLGRSLEALASAEAGDADEKSRLLLAAATRYGAAASLHADALRRPPDGDAAARKRMLESYVSARSSEGEALYRAGEFGRAVAALTPFFEEARRYEGAPGHTRAVYFLALAHYEDALLREKSGAPADDAAAMQVLLYFTAPRFEGDPLWSDAAYLLARLHHRRGEWEKAIAVYDRLIDRKTAQRAEAMYYRALAQYEWHTPEALRAGQDAFAAFARKYAAHDLAWRARLYGALCAFDLGDYGSAAERLAACEHEADVTADGGLHFQALLRHGQALLLKDPAEPDAAARVLRAAIDVLRKAGGAEPTSRALLGRALYWHGSALARSTDPSPETLDAAAGAFHSAAEDFREEVPELAEESLYKEGEAYFRAGRHDRCALAGARYRERYPEGEGRFFLASLELSGRNAFHAPEDALPAAERGRAAEYFAKAAALEAAAPERRPERVLELRYYAGLAQYYAGDHAAAAATLMEIYEELSPSQRSSAQHAELVFYLADALGQRPQEKTSAPDRHLTDRHLTDRPDDSRTERARLLLAARLFEEYLQSAAGAPGAPWTRHVATALVHQGQCYQWAGDARAARKSFERRLAESSGEAAAQVRFSLASACLELGDLNAASTQYQRAARDASEAPAQVQALSMAASVERERGQPRSALRLSEEAIRSIESDGAGVGHDARAEAHFQRAMALADVGEGETAASALEELLREYPRSGRVARARVRLAHLYLDGKRPEAGLAAIRPLIDAGRDAEDRDEALYVQAWCYRRMAAREAEPGPDARGGSAASEDEPDPSRGPGRASAMRSEASYRQLIREHPESALVDDARLELAQELFNRGDYPEARRWFEEVRRSIESLAAPPSSPAESGRQRRLIDYSLLGLGYIALERKEYESARELFDRVTDRPGGELTEQALFQAARSWMSSRGEREAIKRFTRLAESNEPGAEDYREESLLRLGECRHRLQEYAQAIAVLERMLEAYPEGALRHEGRFALGFALQYLDRPDEAIEAFRKVVAGTNRPVAARAQYQIGECAMDQGKFREAASEFQTVAANFDFEGEHRVWVRRALLAAGLAYQAAGDETAAARQWMELQQRFPQSEEARAARDRQVKR